MTEQEFEHTAQKMRPHLIEVGRSFFGSEAQAEDAAQEALLRLWVLRGRVKDCTDAESLLVRMVKNICISVWREERKQAEFKYSRILTSEIKQIENDENTRMLQLAISNLLPSEQRLFRMRQELEMDVQQIAATTGIHPRSVSVIISNARRKVIEQLKKGGIL